ncbi:MAG TPA: CBS domain-containing protein [Gaiellaceae bacterium]|jgi:CBS domain-containing protein
MKTIDTTTVGEAMHEGVVTCDVDEPLTSVARTMAQQRIHCVVVWQEPATGAGPELWGVVSDLDLVKVAAGEDVGGRTAGGSARTPAPMITPDETLRRAAQLMAEHEVAHLVVVDTETTTPVGVISTLDVARALTGNPRLSPAL